MSNLAYARFGHCFVLVHDEKPATDEAWGRWVDFVTAGGKALGSQLRVLVVSRGGSPTPKQRRLIHDRMPRTDGGVMTAIVTTSFVGRAVVSTMGLFNEKIRAFAADRVPDALDYLGVAAPLRPEIHALIAKLEQQLGLR